MFFFLNRNNAFKQSTSLLKKVQTFFVFLMFFRANVSQVKLHNICFSLICCQTNYQTIKLFPPYLQN